MQTQDPKGAPTVLGALVTPNPSMICTGHPECPGWGPAPGASPGLGRVMGGTDQLPQCCCAGQAGCPVGGVGVSLGRGPPSCALADLQGQILAPGQLTQI